MAPPSDLPRRLGNKGRSGLNGHFNGTTHRLQAPSSPSVPTAGMKPLTESEGLRASRFQEPRANAGSSLTGPTRTRAGRSKAQRPLRENRTPVPRQAATTHYQGACEGSARAATGVVKPYQRTPRAPTCSPTPHSLYTYPPSRTTRGRGGPTNALQAKPPCSSPAMAVHSPSPSTATGSAAAVPAYQRQSDRPPGLYTYTPSRATRGASASTQKRHINCVRDSVHALPGDGRRHRTGLQRFRQPVLESNTGSDLLSPPRHVQAPGQHKGIPRQKRMRVHVARSSRSSATTREQRHAGWLSQYWPVTRGPVPRWTGTVHTHTHTHTLPPASIDSRSVLHPTHTRTHVTRLGRR